MLPAARSARILQAAFETSAADPGGWPAAPDPRQGDEGDGAGEGAPPEGVAEGLPEQIPELAFVGRSNVGKSSLLNALAERKGLARTSSEPGRTRLVNFFRLEVEEHGGDRPPRRRALRFVDLPGFGFARVSKAERATWRPAIQRYLEDRAPLRAVVLLFDARRVPLRREDEAEVDEELDLLAWIAGRGITVVPTITKADKLAKHERKIVADRLRLLAGQPVVLASAVTNDGIDRLWARLLGALDAPPAGLTAPTHPA